MDDIDEILGEVLGGVANEEPADDPTGKWEGSPEFNVGTAEGGSENEFGAVPIRGESDGVHATVLAVFEDVDISPLTIELMMDDDAPTRQTVVLWKIDNQTGSTVEYGNDAITYASDSRLKLNPTGGTTVVWDPARIGAMWNRAPSSGSTADVQSGLKSRWVSLVDVPESSRLGTAVLYSYDHGAIVFDLSAENVADASSLPF